MGTVFKSRLAGMADDMHSFAADLGGWVRDGARRLGGAERRRLAERFAAWALADGGLADASLRAWIDGLDATGREALAEQVAAFCADFEIGLAWLVDGELLEWPDLQERVQAAVTHYCLACKAAVDCDEDLVRFRRRRLWQRKMAPAGSAGTIDPLPASGRRAGEHDAESGAEQA